MNQNWYDTQSWYAPLITGPTDAGENIMTLSDTEKSEGKPASAGGKKITKKQGIRLTPGRIVGLVILLILVIAATSLAFQQIGSDGTAAFPDLPTEKSEMPKENG